MIGHTHCEAGATKRRPEHEDADLLPERDDDEEQR